MLAFRGVMLVAEIKSRINEDYVFIKHVNLIGFKLIRKVG